MLAETNAIIILGNTGRQTKKVKPQNTAEMDAKIKYHTS